MQVLMLKLPEWKEIPGILYRHNIAMLQTTCYTPSISSSPPPPPPSLPLLPSLLQETLALRDGRYISVAVEQLVVGDMVEVKFGDRVPADIRIITASSFKVTGHTVLV